MEKNHDFGFPALEKKGEHAGGSVPAAMAARSGVELAAQLQGVTFSGATILPPFAAPS